MLENYPGIVTGLSTDERPYKSDLWLFQETDTGNTYIKIAQKWILLSKLIKEDFKSGSNITDSDGVINVVFVTPMANADYSICFGSAYKVALSNIIWGDKATTGFTIFVRKNSDGVGFADVTIDWQVIPYSS